MNVIDASDRVRLAALSRGGWIPSPELTKNVAQTLADVRARGDEALIDHASRLRVPIPMHEGAKTLVPPEVADALRLVKERVTRFYERQQRADLNYADEDGTRYGLRFCPLESVAAYVPGGPSARPSSVIMNIMPAKIAGVNRTVVLSPPQADGNVHPAVLFACSLCEVDELYAVGGAAALAAAAYGTRAIAPVEKIVGSGDRVMTEAKRQLFGVCAVDGLSGPPEVLVVADDAANSELVAGELLAQAECDECARVAVVSESRSLLDAVAQLLDTLDVKTLPRGAVIADVIARSCSAIYARDRDDVLAVIEAYAPERLALMVRDPESYLKRVRRIGAAFVGDMTPVACGDYVAGIPAAQPSCGAARFSSGLTLLDFMRSFSVVENSRERMLRDVQPLAALADFEGLPQHAQTARMRGGA